MAATKERIRVSAGRQGAPVASSAPAKSVAVVHHAGSAPALSPEPTSMLAVIARAAADPNVHVDKMQALLKMQQEIEDRDARKAFTIAFAKLQKKLPSISRDGKIEIREKNAPATARPIQSTPYATFNGIMKAIKKPLDDHGFTLSFATAPGPEGKLIVRGILAHEEGHERVTEFPLPADPSGSKNNVQGWGSSLSYGKRYCTIALCNVVSHDPRDADTDGHIGDFKAGVDGKLVEAVEMVPASRGQLEELRVLMRDCGVTEDMVCNTFKIEKLADLPADMVEGAKTRCRNHKNRATR